MRLKFTIDPEYDIQTFFHLLRQEHWQSRVADAGISYDLAEKIHNASSDEELSALYQELHEFAMEQYSQNHESIEKSKEAYQASWDEIIDEFSKTAADLTAPWYYDEYQCVVTHLCKGVSNWNGNKIGRTWKEDPDSQRRITAHEILLAHYFSIHRNRFPNSGLTDEQIWKLAEIAAMALTGLEPSLKKFWPHDEKGYYTDHNYPELVELQEQMQDAYVHRTNFDEYVRKGMELVKENEAKEHIKRGTRPLEKEGGIQ